METDAVIVAFYGRVSTDDQRDAGTIATQQSYARRRALADYCTRCGQTVARELVAEKREGEKR